MSSSIIKVACILDSLSDQYFTRLCNDCITYHHLLQAYLDSQYPGKFQVEEFVVWATTICEGSHSGNAYKDHQEYLDSLDSVPDYVVIVGGSNDSKSNIWDT